jgi:hypothetical protein
MKELVFQVEFLSDIVLPASSNTEGNISQLDFIPGSNFLGMVAKKYDNFSNSFDVFHSGKVRFGDAQLLVGDDVLYKMPFSFFHPKLEEHRVFHHHFLADEKRKELGQLKQMRSGYIFPNLTDNKLKVKHINYNYAQKSAYDAKKRRSKTGSMYGYRAIEAGTKWQFIVKYDDAISSKDIELLKTILTDSKRLGKSKSAQYGRIAITEGGTVCNVGEAVANSEVILYAKSRIALVDNDGNATYDLNHLVDGATVVYDKCQIRTSTFTPYNGAMQTKTYERLVIEAGSVIVLSGVIESQVKELEKGVGLYVAEGFGELIVNPSFLMQKEELSLCEKDSEKTYQREKIEKESTPDTVSFLINRHNSEIDKLTLADEVAMFIKNPIYKNIKNSQWGTIRSICTAGTKRFREDIKDYISSGKVEWDRNQIDTLLDEKHSLVFIKLVAIQMPKENGGAE